jgi:DNA-binding NarL/FixJ family response regulator
MLELWQYAGVSKIIMSSGAPIRVLLVDHKLIVRAGVRLLIESWPHLTVVGEAGSPVDALEISVREKPDIILLNLELGHISNGLECISDLLSTAGKWRIIVLTGDVRDPETYHRAIHLGAMGLVLKEQTPEELREAILKVHAGEIWVDRKWMTGIITGMSRASQSQDKDTERARITSLTEREREVLNLVCEGLKNKEIATRLFISLSTVRHHLTSIFSKLQVASRFELIIFAYRHKLVNLLRAQAQAG